MKKGLWICGLLCLLCLTGYGKRELLEEKLDAAEIDKIVVTMAMGNPADGAEGKVITEKQEIAEFLFLFNHACIGEKIEKGNEWEAGSASYTFYRGEEQVLKLNCNANDAERIWVNDAFYEISYPEDRATPDGLYHASGAKTVRVDENGRVI